MRDSEDLEGAKGAMRSRRRGFLGGALAVTLGGLVGAFSSRGRASSTVAASQTQPSEAYRWEAWSKEEGRMAGSNAEKGYGVGGDEGRALWFLDGLVVWKALGADTAGRYELVEQLGAGGYEAPLHTHGGETEGFYVVEGDLTMVVGDLRFHAGPGAFGYVPIGVPH